MIRHRFNRRFEVVRDDRTLSPAFEAGKEWQGRKVERGRVVRQSDPIYAVRKSSPAREAYRAARRARRQNSEAA